MKYTKASFAINPDSETNREILIAYLSELDFESFDEVDDEVHAFFPIRKVTSSEIENCLESVPFKASFKLEEMPDINWNEEWEKNYFEPLLLDKKVLIRAPFHSEYPEATYEIIIDPNMAFGTGNHETTSLMMNHLSDINLEGQAVLDMGCGTGILGIYASMLGAKDVTAIDIDSWSFEATVENSRLNKVGNLQAFIGDAQLLSEKKFDIVLANIQKNIILQDIEKYVSVLNEDGLLVVSGFYKNDLEDIIGKAAELTLHKVDIKEQNDWIAVSFQK
ncbi:50S ribosomal protein L11 methyltransferase [uncultured Sunxiuqinia sp.]|uniref:50S ribosomal protein L11 methyltransferase n=1 Tax=uncultured Sunxiuqinia sp. TaxID=1573825 RepID=UPI002AA73C5C|nr:50S ribosomal protein L11 methyltransferase [uncultured Sunxiuqinia sp.]